MSGFSTARRALSRLDVNKASLFVCDMQEKFRPLIYNMETCINRSALCVSICKELSVPVIVTQQYTKVFGPSVPELTNLFPPSAPVFDKTRFSMLTPECSAAFSALDRDQVIVVGIEAHVCVLQTVLELLDMGKDVHVITDAVSSQRSHDRTVAMQRMESAGAVLSTSESAIFDLLKGARVCCVCVFVCACMYRNCNSCSTSFALTPLCRADAKHSHFKACSAIVKQHNAVNTWGNEGV